MNYAKQLYGNIESAMGGRVRTLTAATGTGAISVALTLAMVFLLFGCATMPDSQNDLEQRIRAAERAVSAGYALYTLVLDEPYDPAIVESVREWTQKAREIALALEALMYALQALGVDIDPMIDRYVELTAPEVADSIRASGRSQVFVAP